MLKIHSLTKIAPLAVFAALAIVPMGARAEDGLGAGAYDVVASAQDARIEERSEPKELTCVEAIKAAWFMRQLQLTDGDVDPAFDTPRECDRNIYAKAEQAKE